MGLLTWLQKRVLNGQPIDQEIDPAIFFSLASEIHIRNLAFYSGVNVIANAISKCEFKTYVDHKEKKGKEYYLFNVEPNCNQNSSQFICKWITKLFEDNECLIIEHNQQLFVADSFNMKEYALYDNVFTQVTVNNFTYNKSFKMSDVLYFKLNNQNVRNLLNRMYDSYGQLIAYGQKSYKKTRGQKGILNVSTMAQKDTKTFEKIMNVYFKDFFSQDSAVLPLFDGYEYNDLGSKTYNNETTRDIRAMIDDIYDFTARALGIPPALLRGDTNVTKDVVTNFLTFCIDPLCDMLQEEINRKRSGYDGFAKGIYLRIDTTSIKHIDLFDVATPMEKLISSGVFTINDILKHLGREPIEEEWANTHFMTKNYSTIEEFLNSLNEGGNSIEKKDMGTETINTS